ncbi:RimJ/RimL family protein N-acetyltransferase [Bradyrhizobium sp. USDA 4532]|uniref:N-acetyltransferase n=1 Tax=unclassified Bradyrhizobium TaxID=2631580 RepID=UPI00209F9C8A|nr:MULTISPECIES: N-acetyltransferase [unclassified Bradyrhizobium]MCP1836222.1 RimJ/RimL family protein N-acetyltransferase [Bradyrhizobium sp. USDA 4545]MCP1920971.1 RimJ/RimL family protein N-acetyltransferase [Bradyrhizobium sp. USDA 4532]
MRQYGMYPSSNHAGFATDRILLTRITGPESSRAQQLREAAMLRRLDRGTSDRPNAARPAAARDQVDTAAAFAIEAAGSGDLLGVSGFGTIDRHEKRATFAPIWSIGRLDEAVLVSHVAHLMTRYAFEVLMVERAEVHLDWRLRHVLDLYADLGFRREGRLRAYFAADEEPSADAAVLSVVRSEWPSVVRRQRGVLAGETWRYRLPSDRPP